MPPRCRDAFRFCAWAHARWALMLDDTTRGRGVSKRYYAARLFAPRIETLPIAPGLAAVIAEGPLASISPATAAALLYCHPLRLVISALLPFEDDRFSPACFLLRRVTRPGFD